MMLLKKRAIIGRIEKVDLPDLELFGVDAKIDTGAYSSAIHCHYIKENYEEKTLTFKLLDPSHPNYSNKEIKLANFSKVKVKSSSGTSQNRYKIKTTICIGNKSYTTNFTLTNRSKMRNPILLGRKVFSKRFFVDASQKYLLQK